MLNLQVINYYKMMVLKYVNKVISKQVEENMLYNQPTFYMKVVGY